MTRVGRWLVIAVLSWAAGVSGDCLPSGRNTFIAGLDALNRGDLLAAANKFDELVKAQPECAEARNNLAVVLVEQGHLTAAAEQLRRAIELRPDYQRARLNLDRVEALLAAQQQPTPHPSAALLVEAPPAAPVAAAPPEAAPAASAPVPITVAVLEPIGTTACVFTPDHRQVCLYRRAPAGIALQACYPLTTARLATWPPWLVASDVTARRIRLVDETGQKRLKVVPEDDATGGDVLALRARDYEALAAQIVPWRTGWVMQEAGTAVDGVDAAASAVRAALEDWRQAWEHKRLDAYVSFYGAGFRPQTERDVSAWRARKQYLFERNGPLTVQVEAASVFLLDHASAAIVSFLQTYRSDTFASRAVKVLRWEHQGGRWTIRAETVLREGQESVGG